MTASECGCNGCATNAVLLEKWIRGEVAKMSVRKCEGVLSARKATIAKRIDGDNEEGVVKTMKRKSASLADVLLGPERVQKSYWDFDGDRSQFVSPKVQEFDIPSMGDRSPRLADPVDADDRDAVMASLGRMAALSQSKDDTKSPVWAAQPSAWLAGSDGTVGQERRGPGGRIMTERGGEAGSYLFREPDPDVPDADNWIEREDGSFARSGAFSAPMPGRVGGVRVSKRAASTVPRGLFSNVVYGG